MANPSEMARGWQARVETAFESWGRLVCRHRYAALVLSVVATAWLVSFLPQLTVDNSTEAFLLPDDPAVVTYNQMRDQFGRDDNVLLGVIAPDIFAPEFLERLRELHEAIETEVPFVSEVDSLLNARVTRGEGDELIVEELLEEWPETPAELEAVRSFALSNPIYRNTLISEDGRLTAIVVTPDTYSAESPDLAELDGFGDGGEGGAAAAPIYLSGPEGDELVDGLLGLIERFDRPDFRLHLAGAIPMTHRINAGMMRDLGFLLPATLALMALILALLFRRISGVVMPLMVVTLSLAATIGVMIAIGIPGSTAVQILPVFLLTVGVCDAVHILALVYRFRGEGADKEEATVRALGHSGLAVLMTSVTTAAGMSSFAAAEMAAVRDLGLLAPIGVALAFVYTMVLLPALIAIFPLPVSRTGRISRGIYPFESFLVSAGAFAVRNPLRILLPTFLLVVLGVLGAVQLRFSHNGLTWFPEHDRIGVDFRVIDSELRGSVNLDLVVDTGEAGGLYDPEMLEAIDALIARIELFPVEPLFIGKSLSILDIVKETHRALGEDRPEMYRIPETRGAVAQELLLFENSGSDDTEDFVDSTFRTARISMRIPFTDALLYPQLLSDIREEATQRLDGIATFQLTGLMTLLAEIFDAVIRTMMRSYAVALAVITPLMMLLLGSLRRGLVSMVPNLLPVLAVLGVCGWFDIALDSTTMMVGAMVIGIAVDDTIHFMHKFHRYFESTGDIETAIQETLRTTGSALLFTSLVLSAGFAMFMFGEMTNLRIFGLLASMATLVAFMADLLVAPALLTLVERWRRSRPPVLGAEPIVSSGSGSAG